jgi:hypothetical protein
VTYKKNTEEWQKTRDYRNEVEQYKDEELIKVWKSIAEIISKFKDYDKTCISRCCNGKRKTHKGFTWKWKSERKKKVSDEEIMWKLEL